MREVGRGIFPSYGKGRPQRKKAEEGGREREIKQIATAGSNQSKGAINFRPIPDRTDLADKRGANMKK